MDTRELSQLQALETAILSRDLSPAQPVGLRFDRLAGEGLLPEAVSSDGARLSTAYHYWKCNCLAVSSLLEGSRSVAALCEEPWVGELSLEGRATGAGVAGGDFDAVLADSSILLSGELDESLAEFRIVLKRGSRVVLLVANWEYEVNGIPVQYDLSFKRYRGGVYAGLVKRTLDPPLEVEYVCMLDPSEAAVRKLVQLPRDRLRELKMRDVPGLERLVISAEVIKINQATQGSIERAGREAGFSRSVVAGAPGILARSLYDAHWLSRALSQHPFLSQRPQGTPLQEAGSPGIISTGLVNEVSQALASSFPFVSATENPHLLGVLIA